MKALSIDIDVRLNATDLGSGSRPCTECVFSVLRRFFADPEASIYCTRYVTPVTGEMWRCTEVRNDPSLCGTDGVGFQTPEEWEGFIQDGSTTL